MNHTRTLLFVAGAALSVAACRGQTSEDPPVHLNPNMDTMPRYDPQQESKFFEDRAESRRPVEGTVSRGGDAHLDEGLVTGKEGDRYVEKVPLPLTEALLARGQERFGIYCVPCHDKTGNGNGIVVRHGYPQATNLLGDYVLHMTDGQVYSAIANGARNMPSYATQIQGSDRWAIVAYVRALEFSQNARIDDVPTERRGGLPVEPE